MLPPALDAPCPSPGEFAVGVGADDELEDAVIAKSPTLGTPRTRLLEPPTGSTVGDTGELTDEAVEGAKDNVLAPGAVTPGEVDEEAVMYEPKVDVEGCIKAAGFAC